MSNFPTGTSWAKRFSGGGGGVAQPKSLSKKVIMSVVNKNEC
jgi:hypothetical protein